VRCAARLLLHKLEGLACRAGGCVQHLEAAAAAAAAAGSKQDCWLAAGMQCDAGEWMPGAGGEGISVCATRSGSSSYAAECLKMAAPFGEGDAV
jgi:hypothetical protein